MVLTGSFNSLLTSEGCKYVITVVYTHLPNQSGMNEFLLQGALPFGESTRMKDEDSDHNYRNKQNQIKCILTFEMDPNGKTSVNCTKLWKHPFNGN